MPFPRSVRRVPGLPHRSRRARPGHLGGPAHVAADGGCALEGRSSAAGVPLFQPWQAVSLLTADDERPGRASIGVLALDLDGCARGEERFALFNAVNVVFGTGGPGGMYADSVYPAEQTGSIGAGACVPAPSPRT
ncbi:MAG: hypothetical protein MZV64_43010 [Ignavibacteriales bacterium]|nr:hypothetical protein [Ignavibacteriales bacterium]